jgi:hypothetical protein
MADPKTRYQLDGVTYEEQPDGSFTKVTPATKPASIADGKISGFKAPKVPVSIPAREKILSEPPTMGEIATPSIPGSGILAGAQSLLTPEGRKSAAQQGISLGASRIPGGGFFTNLAKSAIGATGGNIVGQALEGKPELDLGETTQEGLLDIGANLLLGSIPFVGAQAYKASKPFIRNVQKYGTKEALARALAASPVIRPEMQAGQYIDPLRERNVAPGMTTRESITAGGDVPMSVGSATGSKTMQFMESLLAPDAAQVLRQEGTKANVGKITKLTAPGTLAERGEVGLGRLKRLKDIFSSRSNAAYGEISNLAKQNTRNITTPGAPVTETVQGVYGPKVKTTVPSVTKSIEGPVFLADSVDLAQQVLPGIRAAMRDIRTPELMGDLTELNTTLSAFTKGRIIPYESARQLQANINAIVYDKAPGLLPSNTQRLLRDLKSRIDTDVLDSMEAHWQGDAANKYRKALGITVEKYKTITPRLEKAFEQGSVTPEKFYDEAFKSASAAREFAGAVGPKMAGAEFLTRARDKHFNPAVGAFDAQNALADWGRPETREVAKTLLTSAQRSAYEQFLKRQVAISGDPSNIGVLAFGTGQATAALGAARDIASLPNNPSRLFSTGAGRIAAVIGLTKFTNEVLLNPARAREASRLLSVNPVRQPQAKIDAQRFILGSKLGTILLRAENGEEVQYNAETGEATKLQ